MKTSSEKSLEKILKTAALEFSRKGFAGARMDEIAENAKVNKASIYYHVGDKEALYARVLSTFIGTALESIIEAVPDLNDPVKALTTLANVLEEHFRKNPLMPRIMMRELADGGERLPVQMKQDVTRLVELEGRIIRDGFKKGVFMEINPLNFHFMMLGSIIMLQVTEQVRKRIFSGSNSENVKKISQDIRRTSEFIVNSILKGKSS
ncbi:MAG: TetR/AcrR family transcriptional regulator [Candidatus Wallbacteria bacterium]|nr:TetR/AcrR family transcriptional regulator [Candidatus Wallbacteria bacterium]